MAYELFYWPTIQGRGEFVRLALEEAGANYVDIARGPESAGQGISAMMRAMKKTERPSLAPPFLRDKDVIVGQTAAILLYLGPRLGLVGAGEADRIWTHQIQLTIADLVTEAHDTHHPIAANLYYEDQQPEAIRRAEDFRENRIPKFLGWFEAILTRNPASSGWLVGASPSYADLSLFQIVEGLSYAFPAAAERALARVPRVAELRARVAERPRIAAYLASERRLPFNQEGIFRRYPELDA